MEPHSPITRTGAAWTSLYNATIGMNRRWATLDQIMEIQNSPMPIDGEDMSIELSKLFEQHRVDMQITGRGVVIYAFSSSCEQN